MYGRFPYIKSISHTAAGSIGKDFSGLYVIGIYLTPPTPRCSVWGLGRGLSADFIGIGAAFQQRRSLYRVSCSTQEDSILGQHLHLKALQPGGQGCAAILPSEASARPTDASSQRQSIG